MKIVLAEREPIVLALRRFGKLLEWNGVTYEMRVVSQLSCPVKATSVVS